MDDLRPLLTKREVAGLLRVSTRTIERLAQRGVLNPIQLVAGGRVRFRADDIEALITDPKEGTH